MGLFSGWFDGGSSGLEGTGMSPAQREEARRQALLARHNTEGVTQLNSALADTTIDDISRSEAVDIFNTSLDVDALAKKIADASEGKGIYAVRKVNQSVQQQRADMPGRRQLSVGR